MEYTELLTELATLRLEVERLTPYHNAHVNHLKRTELAKYGITYDAEVTHWCEQYVTGESEEVIAVQVKGLTEELKVNEKPAYVDPSGNGNGGVSRGEYRGKTTGYELGRTIVKQANGRLNPARSIVKAEVRPPAPKPTQNNGLLTRLFGR